MTWDETAILCDLGALLPSDKWKPPLEPLEGGLLNGVWRARSERCSVVVKRAPPHVAAAPEIPLDPARLRFEADALALFAPGGALRDLARNGVTPPCPLAFDARSATLAMEDCGNGPDLFSLRENEEDGERVGAALGRFIGGLHRETLGRAEYARRFDNRPIQEARSETQYRAAHRHATQSGAGKTTVRRIRENAAALARFLEEPGRCLIMGDLWPASVLLRSDGLRLVDWEFAHYGRPLQDCAHFAAHCWMLEARGASRRIWPSFAAAYRAALGASFDRLWTTDDARMARLHAGAEILARAAGPFGSSGAYAGLPADHPALVQARAAAIRLLEAPGETDFLTDAVFMDLQERFAESDPAFNNDARPL